jgi:hypothetical protein
MNLHSTRFVILLSLAAGICLSGCATTPDPAKVCTSEWIAPRADQALERIEKRTDASFRAVRKAAAAYVSGDTPGPLTLLSLRNALGDLEDELRDGRGARDLRMLATTCNDPEFIRETLTEWLDDKNIPSQVMAALNSFNIVDRLIDLAEGETADLGNDSNRN